MKKGKEFLSFALALLLALGCLSLSAGAKESSGACGENLTWTLSAEDVLTISGSGEMESYSGTISPWGQGIKTLVVGNGVTSIGDGAFGACENLSDVSLPDSLLKIGKYAFSSCYGLTSISIPASVTSMGEGVLFDCFSLVSIQVAESNPNYASRDGILFSKDFSTLLCYPAGKPETQYAILDGVTSIENYALEGCSNLATVTIPSSITGIGKWAFLYCPGLKSAVFQGNVPSVGEEAFYGAAGDFCVYYYPGATGWTTPEWTSSSGDTYPCKPMEVIPTPTPIPTPRPTPTPTPPPAPAPVPASCVDVKPGDYYYDAVQWAVEHGITAGTDDTHFSPGASCTRAQAVTFLWRAAGEPNPQGAATGFIDVKAGAYYEKAVQWAVEQGITAGTSATTFSPESKCTRAQIVSFLYRYEKKR